MPVSDYVTHGVKLSGTCHLSHKKCKRKLILATQLGEVVSCQGCNNNLCSTGIERFSQHQYKTTRISINPQCSLCHIALLQCWLYICKECRALLDSLRRGYHIHTSIRCGIVHFNHISLAQLLWNCLKNICSWV